MGKTIAIVNQKGGVGKTTTAVNLAAALGARGRKVLLCDVDPQGNATSGLGVEKRGLENTSYEMLIGKKVAGEVIMHTAYEGVDLVPAGISLIGAEIELVEFEDRESRLKLALGAKKPDYDYIFFDCPPSLGLLTLNSLCAADTFLVPVQCEFYALEGLSQLINTVRLVKRRYNPRLELEGVLLTMYDARLNLTVMVAEEIKKHFPEKVYASAIPRNVRLSEAPSFGEPVLYYDRNSKGAKAYGSFCDEFLESNEKGERK